MHLLQFVLANNGVIDGIEADRALLRKFSQPDKVLSAVWAVKEFINGMSTDRHARTHTCTHPPVALSTGRPPTGVGCSAHSLVLVAVHIKNRITANRGTWTPMLCDVYVFANGSPQQQRFHTFRIDGAVAHFSGMLATAAFPAIVGLDVPFNLPGTQNGDVTVLTVMIP
jgi:hypothetical protein